MAKKNKKRDKNIVSTMIFMIIMGIIMVFVSFVLRVDVKLEEGILMKVLTEFLLTVGLALIATFLFDFTINRKKFMDSITKQLSNVIISKEFLSKTTEEEKRNAFSLILQPTESQIEQFSRINDYFQKKIKEAMLMFNTNFKTGYNLRTKVIMNNEKSRVECITALSYAIYKVNNEYKTVNLVFENEESEVLETKIFTSNGEEVPIENQTSEKGRDKFDIPQKFNEFPYLIIKREVREIGYSHWMDIDLRTLTPCDKVTYYLECQDDLIIRKHIFMDDSKNYNVKESEDKKTISIESYGWLDALSGFLIIVGKDEKD